MYNIFVFLNEKNETYLSAQIRTYLTNKGIEHNIDVLYCGGEMVSYHHKGERYKIFHRSVFQMIDNFLHGRDLLEGLDLIDIHRKVLKFIEKQVNTTSQYDLYCFSSYSTYSLDHLYFIFLLMRKYKDPLVLMGGPWVILSENFRNMLKKLNIPYSIGDIAPSVFNILEGNFSSESRDNFLPLTHLTAKDVPVYTEEEIAYTDGLIYLNGSRGCSNNCYYCCSPKMCSYGFNALKREVMVDWIEYYNTIPSIKKIRLNDSSISTLKPDILLDGLIRINNRIEFFDFYFNLVDITEELLIKMKQANFTEIRIGMECSSPVNAKNMNRKMPTQDEIYEKLLLVKKYGIYMELFSVVGIPGETEEAFESEYRLIEKIYNNFDNVGFKFFGYYLAVGSYIYDNQEDFGVRAEPLLDHNEFPEIPEFHSIIDNLINKNVLDYPLKDVVTKRWEKLYNNFGDLYRNR